jgi:hypothetical protein
MEFGGFAPGVTTQQRDRSRVLAQQAEDDADRGRLAGSIGPEEPVDLPSGDFHVEPVQGSGGSKRLHQT